MSRDGLRRNNLGAEKRIAALIDAARNSNLPIIHIRHEGTAESSYFRSGSSGFEVKDEACEHPGEPVLLKRVNSAFIGTGLEERLRSAGIHTLIIVGATTNHCIETTTRMAGNLGFDVRLVRDATWTFDRTGPDGDFHSADEIHAISLANLNGEFASIVTADQILASL